MRAITLKDRSECPIARWDSNVGDIRPDGQVGFSLEDLRDGLKYGLAV